MTVPAASEHVPWLGVAEVERDARRQHVGDGHARRIGGPVVVHGQRVGERLRRRSPGPGLSVLMISRSARRGSFTSSSTFWSFGGALARAEAGLRVVVGELAAERGQHRLVERDRGARRRRRRRRTRRRGSCRRSTACRRGCPSARRAGAGRASRLSPRSRCPTTLRRRVRGNGCTLFSCVWPAT